MQKIDTSKLPPEVLAAYQSAQDFLATKYQGRRNVPKPVHFTMAIEEEEGAALHAILIPPIGGASRTIERAGHVVANLVDKGGEALLDAIDKMHGIVLVECCFWAGIPATKDRAAQVQEDGEDESRVRAKAFLLGLKDEGGSLAKAYRAVASAIGDFMAAPEVSLGK